MINLRNIKINFQVSRESNLGPQGKKQECYLCAIQQTHHVSWQLGFFIFLCWSFRRKTNFFTVCNYDQISAKSIFSRKLIISNLKILMKNKMNKDLKYMDAVFGHAYVKETWQNLESHSMYFFTSFPNPRHITSYTRFKMITRSRT